MSTGLLSSLSLSSRVGLLLPLKAVMHYGGLSCLLRWGQKQVNLSGCIARKHPTAATQAAKGSLMGH